MASEDWVLANFAVTTVIPQPVIIKAKKKGLEVQIDGNSAASALIDLKQSIMILADRSKLCSILSLKTNYCI